MFIYGECLVCNLLISRAGSQTQNEGLQSISGLLGQQLKPSSRRPGTACASGLRKEFLLHLLCLLSLALW